MDSVLQTPIEQRRIGLRSIQVSIERELAQLLEKIRQEGLDEATQRATLDKLVALKSKLEKITTAQLKAQQQFEERLAWVGTAGESEQLNLWLGDYFLHQNYADTAKELANATGTFKILDFELYSKMHAIRTSLANHDTGPVLQWCQENKVSLRKQASELEYEARKQTFIELVRRGSNFEAIRQSRKHLGKFVAMHQEDLSQLTSHLVDKRGDGFAELTALFEETYLKLMGKTSQGLLDLVCSGLSVLRTRSCKINEKPTRNLNCLRDHLCPACSKDLGALAVQLPYAHYTKSSLEAEMVLLPNRRCYGNRLLRELSAQVGIVSPQVCDPVTLEIFDESELRRIFPI